MFYNYLSKSRVWLLIIIGFLPLIGYGAGGDEQLQWQGYSLDERFVTLKFSIPYDGMVELRILDEEGQLVWQDQKVKNRGDNSLRFKRTAFTEGSTYTFQLNYKKGSFQEKLKIED